MKATNYSGSAVHLEDVGNEVGKSLLGSMFEFLGHTRI